MDFSKLDEEWNNLIAVTRNLTRELEAAETSLRQLDLTLTELDTRLCKVEADQSSWSQAPEYEALEAESLALELMTQDLRRLEEEVLKSKIATDSSQTASTTITNHIKHKTTRPNEPERHDIKAYHPDQTT